MSTTALAQKNVVAKISSELKAVPPTQPKTTEKQPIDLEVENDLKPLEDRLFKINQLRVLHDKYNSLLHSKMKLETFVLEADNDTACLSFSDDNRKSFTTYNKELLPEMLDFLKKKIDEKIKALQPKLTW
jgi:hypothetical protein